MTTSFSGKRPIAIGAILDSFGSHPAAWLLSPFEMDPATDIDHYVALTRMAEEALFDLVFFADSPGIPDGPLDQLCRTPKSLNMLEPLTLLGALAVSTRYVGLVATASTSYHEPFNVARFFASLDHISHGRIGWNAVTTASASASYNFGRDGAALHATRYERASEFIDVVRGLWDSWADDAFIRDRTAVRYADPGRAFPIDHRGKHFEVRGPLNIARSPQGRPVLVQAGGSDAGRDLAARTAEVVFTVETALDGARRSYADLKNRMGAYGRHSDELRMMHGITIVVGRDEADAQDGPVTAKLCVLAI